MENLMPIGFCLVIGLTLPCLSVQSIIGVTATAHSDGNLNSSLQHNSDQVQFTIRGLVPPVFTPLHEDGHVNYSAIIPYAKFLADAGIKGVLVGGTTGEGTSLDKKERMLIVEKWLEARKVTNLHIMVQVGGAPLSAVLEMTRHAVKVGVDSIMTLPELYFKPTSVAELVDYEEMIAKAAPNLPVLYYHIPRHSKVEIDIRMFVKEATARIPNFKGLKYSGNDLVEAVNIKRALVKGQEIFLGNNELVAPATLLGIKSFIGATSNMVPKLIQNIIEAVECNHLDKARDLEEKLSLMSDTLAAEGRKALKVGMELTTGIQMGPPSPPLKPVSPEAKSRIKNKFKALGVLKM